MSTLVAANLAAAAAMAGLIWFVQIVHYPLYALVGADHFRAYEQAHQRLTTFVVGPLMIAETLLAIALVADPGRTVGRAMPIGALVVLALIHLSTATLQVPAHRVLSDGYEAHAARRLVITNWVRTTGWTARVALILAIVITASTG